MTTQSADRTMRIALLVVRRSPSVIRLAFSRPRRVRGGALRLRQITLRLGGTAQMQRDRFQKLRARFARKTGFRFFASRAIARFPIRRNRLMDKKSRQLNELEQVLIEKVYQLFRNLL